MPGRIVRRIHIVRLALLLALAACAPRGDARLASAAELARVRVPDDARVTAETTFVAMRGRYALYRVRLAGDGVSVTGRLLAPSRGAAAAAGSTSAAHPAVLLNDGRELDSRALEHLPPEFGDVVVLSLDYPAALPYEISLADALLRGDRLRRAAERVAPTFSLGAAYLVRRADVDAERVAIAATSFAVPFAVVAAAADARFRNVVLVYGAGDLDGVLAANLALRPRALRPAAAWLATRPFAALEPERWIAHVAPRPIVMINGRDDPQMPRAAVEALYSAARAPKSLVWLRTGHLLPSDTALVRALVDTALARLPVLRGR